MALTILRRGDDAIIIYDQDDPRGGIVIKTVAEAEELIAGLAATVSEIQDDEAARWIRMRAVVNRMAEEDGGLG